MSPLVPKIKIQSNKAQRKFTDREEPRKLFENNLDCFQGDSAYRILNFYGVGGQGKSALCEQFQLIVQEKRKTQGQLDFAKVDFENSEHRLSINALISIRVQLANKLKIPFPAFDTAFSKYFTFSYPEKNIKEFHPELFSQPDGVINDLSSILGDIFTELPGLNLLYKYSKGLSGYLNDWLQRRGNNILKNLDKLDGHKLCEALPVYLGDDLSDWLSTRGNNDRRIVIFLDTYEALWRNLSIKVGIGASRVDEWIRELIQNSPGVLYVLLGRDQLNWHEVDPDWATVVDAHLLGELSREDADSFLRSVPIHETDIRRTIVSSSCLPYYLDLQADLYSLIRARGNTPTVDDFGDLEQKIHARLFDHVSPDIQRQLEILSFPNLFDENIVRLLSEKFLGGPAVIDLSVVLRFSFVNCKNNKMNMHNLMKDFLQDSLRKREKNLFIDIHKFLGEHFASYLYEIKRNNDKMFWSSYDKYFPDAYMHLFISDNLDSALSLCEAVYRCYFTQGKHRSIYVELLCSLEAAKGIYGNLNKITADCYHRVSQYHIYDGNYSEAIKTVTTAIEIYTKLSLYNTPRMIPLLQSLASYHRLNKKLELAKKLAFKCLEKNKVKTNPMYEALDYVSYKELAAIYTAEKDYQSAEKYTALAAQQRHQIRLKIPVDAN
jgi:hypothetical protein